MDGSSSFFSPSSFMHSASHKLYIFFFHSAVDSAAAGAGTLEVQVTHKGQPVRAECRKVAEGQYHYTFKPLNVGRYEVRATFNGDVIPGRCSKTDLIIIEVGKKYINLSPSLLSQSKMLLHFLCDYLKKKP